MIHLNVFLKGGIPMQPNMILAGRQELRQKLVLNADLLQALDILRLPAQELRTAIYQKSYENPLLELEEAPEPAEEMERPPDTVSVEEAAEEAPAFQSLQGEIWSTGLPEEDACFSMSSGEPSFTDQLNEQVGALAIGSGLAVLCRHLVACLDRRGYFHEATDVLARELGCESFDVMQALYIIQSLEPAGVGARTLEECLLLQLMRGSHFNQYTIRLVRDGLPLLAAGNLTAIAGLLGLSRTKAQAICTQVRALNPIPSRGYNTGEAGWTVLPDASVEKTENGFAVVHNRGLLPGLKLNTQYVDMLGSAGDPQIQDYLQQKYAEAQQFIRAIKKRQDTFSRVLSQVICQQPAFFADGKTLRPMTMESIAVILDLNVSTVSRAVYGKYITCVAGTIALKSLFTAGVQQARGEAVSAVLLKHMLQDLIQAEDARHPLSDESLCNILKMKNIDISRRTVAKYRSALGIETAARRRAT